MSKDEAARMLRVNQAGEYGASRIYAGQIAVMGNRAPHAAKIAAMAAQEEAHRQKFDALMAARGVRPTLLQPVWSVAGHALGAATALLGPAAAMACTAAIEEEIDRHYTRQLDTLETGPDSELTGLVRTFRDDEREHRQIALDSGAESAPVYPLLSGAIRFGCRVAIRLSERI
jgi:ubiquinone biosynthesis monooxygenase Coq7